MKITRTTATLCTLLIATACGQAPEPEAPAESYDVLIVNGTVYDGSGSPPRLTDVGISGDVIAAIGDLTQAE